MKTISVLGSGWLGLPLARHFIDLDYTVKASTTSDNRLAELKSVGIDPFIVNLDLPTSDLDSFLQADILTVNIPSKNVAGFGHLIEEMKNSTVENVIFVSSTSVYQNINKTITESDFDCYSSSPLLDIEDLFSQWGKDQTTIIRFGGLIGYRRHPGWFFRSGRAIQNPESPVNLIHRDDCIEIISRIVEQGVWGEIFNCCADTHPTKREFYTRAIESLGAELPIFGDSDPEAGKRISNEKVKRLLSYTLKHPDLMNLEFEQTG